jgi:ElaB/YqjD/DUF883 family membrane-anchored ribosome-binding protein
MADTETLRYAETVNNEAEALASEIDSEVHEMKRAVQQGQDTLELIKQVEMAIGDHTQYIKDESKKSHKMQQQAVETLENMGQLSSQLTELILPNLLEQPALQSKSYEQENFPSLPEFRVPNRKELENIPLPSLQQNEAAWDMLAQDFTNFEEQFEASLQEADKLAEAAKEKLREVEKPQAEKIVGAKKRKAEKLTH